jgi:hypothetical protein
VAASRALTSSGSIWCSGGDSNSTDRCVYRKPYKRTAFVLAVVEQFDAALARGSEDDLEAPFFESFFDDGLYQMVVFNDQNSRQTLHDPLPPHVYIARAGFWFRPNC